MQCRQSALHKCPQASEHHLNIWDRMSDRDRCIQRRRLTVAPTSSSFQWRDKVSTPEEGSNTRSDSESRHSSFATDRLIKVSRMFSIDKTRDVIRVVLQDSDRIRYTKLACEHEELMKEMKRLRGFVQELAEKYESARSLDPVRRYKKLQSMTKTIVLNLRLAEPESLDASLTEVVRGSLPRGDVLQSSVKQREMKLKHERVCNNFTSDEVTKEIDKLTRQNEALQTDIDEIIDAINELDEKQKCSKTEPFIKRYILLKSAIKDVIKFSQVAQTA
nr:unnamed protein product [Spirometra erinaceieuropaei]